MLSQRLVQYAWLLLKVSLLTAFKSIVSLLMAREKRPLEKDVTKEGMPDEKRQRVPALASVIVEAVKMDSLQKLCSTLEPLLRRVVGEEVERVLAKLATAKVGFRSSPKRIQGSDSRCLRLQFRNKLALPLFTGSKLEGEQGSTIHVVLQDAIAGQVVTAGAEASAKLEIVVLEGDFSADDEEDWQQEEFENHEVRERDGKRPLLTGDLSVILKEGVGTLGELTFTDNSSWIRSRKFRLGVKISSGYCEGLRIREAKTEAFTVKDHRGELYKKHYPPALHDEVWRLDKIGKDGAFHKRLNQSGILTVEDFLRLVVMDPQKLRNILGNGMSNKMWEGTVEHAKTCVLSGKLHVYYADEKQNIGVIFNNIFQLMGLIADGQYMSVDSLSDSEKVYVDKLVKVAYENWENVVEYDGEALIGVKPYKLRGIDAHTEDPIIGQGFVVHNLSTDVPSNQQYDVSVKSLQLSETGSGGAAVSHAGGSSTRHMHLPVDQKYSNHTHQSITEHQHNQSISGTGLDISLSPRQPPLLNIPHQNLLQSGNSAAMTGLALGPPQSTITTSFGLSVANPNHRLSGGSSSLGSDWPRYKESPHAVQVDELFSEEELRARSLEMLENEDMHLQIQQLLRMFNTASGETSSSFSSAPGDVAYPFGIFSPSPDLNVGTDRSRLNGRANVGWLKLKAALRWGIFIRKRAAARRAQLEEVEDE